MSVFNATQFENTEFTGALDTTLVPPPEGDFPAVLSKYEFKQITSNKSGESRTYTFLELQWDFSSVPEVVEVTGRDKVLCRQSIMLDLTDAGTLDMGKGKNVGLGKLREALGQNHPSKPWRFGDMVGNVALCRIAHRIDDNTGDIFAEVKKVAELD